MTEEEFKNKFYEDFDNQFLACVEDKIFENENFLNLIKMQDLGILYSWFCLLKEPTNFQQIVSLYYHLKRGIEGYSNVWFLKVNIHSKINLPERDFEYDSDDWKLVSDSDPIFTDEHKKIFLEHRVGENEITSYDFYRFNWEDVEFLTNIPENKLIQDHCKTKQFGNQERSFIDQYWKLDTIRDVKILNRFTEKNPLTWR